jgi:hypothetical protein
LSHGIALFDIVLYKKNNPYAVFEFSIDVEVMSM